MTCLRSIRSILFSNVQTARSRDGPEKQHDMNAIYQNAFQHPDGTNESIIREYPELLFSSYTQMVFQNPGGTAISEFVWYFAFFLLRPGRASNACKI